MSYLKQTLTEIAQKVAGTPLPGLEPFIEKAINANTSILDAVLDSNKVDETAFLKELAKSLDYPFWEEPLITVPVELKEAIPARIALSHYLLPAKLSGDSIWLLTYNPFNTLAHQQVSQAISLNVHYVMYTRSEIEYALNKTYGVGANLLADISAGTADPQLFDYIEESIHADDEDYNADASVANFVNVIIMEAIHDKASDIHFENFENELKLRVRIDGTLHDVKVPANLKHYKDGIISRIKIMSGLDIAERRLPQDGRISFNEEGFNVDIRVATIPTVSGESVSLRLVGKNIFSFDKLNLTPDNEKIIRGLLGLSNGVILVTGPTGSGKSTTLYTMLYHLKEGNERIITVEDPVENQIPGILQINTQAEINLTFATGLKSILRADPNIIMIGEIRDKETAEISIQSALTGHLVLSTLHTNNAIGGIFRLLNLNIDSEAIVTSVRAILAQRLVRLLCPKCKEAAHYDDEYLKGIGFDLSQKSRLMQARGCEDCKQSGFKGRVPILEIFILSPKAKEAIMEKKTFDDIERIAISGGMQTLRMDGFAKAAEGLTTIEEVLSETAIQA